jgi:hypothetical protein
MVDEDASRWLNGLLGGDPDETFCSRLWRLRWRRPWYWLMIARINWAAVNRLGEEPGHCRRAAENHKLRAMAPDEIRRWLDG